MADLEKTKEILFDEPTLIEKQWKVVDLIRALTQNAEINAEGDISLTISANDLGAVLVHLEEYLDAQEKLAVLGLLVDRIKKAHRIFRKPGGFHKRASKTLRYLGFHTGRRRPAFNKEEILHDYLSLIFDDVPKWEAIETVKRKHGIQSREAAYKMLERIKREKPGLIEKKILPTNC